MVRKRKKEKKKTKLTVRIITINSEGCHSTSCFAHYASKSVMHLNLCFIYTLKYKFHKSFHGKF